MKTMLRTLLALAGLAVATAAPAQTAWPDLTDATSYSFASNRLSVPSAVAAASTATRVSLSHVYQVSPPYAVSNLRILFVNFYVTVDATPNPERCPGNPKNVDFATVFVGGTAYPVTFGSSLSARVGDCEFIWSDPLRDASGALVTIPAGTTYYIRSSQSVDAVGQNITTSFAHGLNARFTSGPLGEGIENGNTVQAAKRTGGTVSPFVNGTPLAGPAMAIGTGWDGSPVFLVVGDSIGAAQADYDYTTSARGVTGFVGRALDDVASTRYNFATLAVPGTKPQDQSSIATGQYRLRMRVLRSIPNKPFNRIMSEMGQNGLSVPASQFRAAMLDWWQFLRLNIGAMPIYQTTFFPHAGQTNATYWTDRANQVVNAPTDSPGGYRDQAIAWLRSGTAGGVPSHVTVLDTYATAADPAEPQKWRTLPGTWTLTNAVGTGVGLTSDVSVSGASAPNNGDWHVFELGTANVELLQIVSVSGTGPWTVRLSNNTAKAHAAGAVLTPAPTGDGTHPGTSAHKAAAAVIVAKKRDGTVR